MKDEAVIVGLRAGLNTRAFLDSLFAFMARIAVLTEARRIEIPDWDGIASSPDEMLQRAGDDSLLAFFYFDIPLPNNKKNENIGFCLQWNRLYYGVTLFCNSPLLADVKQIIAWDAMLSASCQNEILYIEGEELVYPTIGSFEELRRYIDAVRVGYDVTFLRVNRDNLKA